MSDWTSGKNSNVKVNLIFNTVYQLLLILLPLVTAPYITRVLGPDPLGVDSKTHAFANYFYLFAMLGVNNYGNRAIARVRDSRETRSRTFWEIYSFQLMVSLFVSALYLIFALVYNADLRFMILLQGFYVLSAVVDVNWFCFGMENFKLTTVRGVIIRLVQLAAVFLLVRKPGDVWIYTTILSVGMVLSALSVWPYVLRSVDRVRPRWSDIRVHIKPVFVLFLPLVGISLYNIMDKVLLGMFSTDNEVAFYSYAERIATIPVTLIIAMDNVIMPRMSNYFSKGDDKAAREVMNMVMLFAMLVATPMAFGMAGIADTFAPWFYGEKFVRSGFYLLLLSPTILLKGWAGALRTQYIIPTGRDRVYVVSIFAGAFVNIALDLALIPTMAGVGAIIGTLAAELTVAVCQFWMCRWEIPIIGYLVDGAAFVALGALMFLCVYAARLLPLAALPKLLIQAAVGVAVYGILAVIYMLRIKKEPMLVNESLKLLRIRKRFQ